MRSNRGGEYYGKYTEVRQPPGPFARLLKEHRIVLRNSNLLKSLWNDALKTVVYMLNRVPTKTVPKKSFELLRG